MQNKQESYDYSNFDWNKISKTYKPHKRYFCSYNDENYHCGCEPKTYRLATTDDHFNVLFIAKLGDIEVYPIVYTMCQYFIFDQTIKPRFYCSDLMIKELQKVQATETVSKCQEKNCSRKIDDNQLVVFDEKIHQHKINLLITIGGDGTILYGMQFFQERVPPPMMCFEKVTLFPLFSSNLMLMEHSQQNMEGTLGFMAMNNLDDTARDIKYVINNLKNKENVQVENKMRLHGIVNNKDSGAKEFEYHSLNEFVIERGGFSSILKIDIFVNEVYLTTFWGDGLIISSPTGSTAYNLSAGGPIIQNEVPSITLTPICPFSLSFRPLVLPKCAKLKLILAEDVRGHGQILADGQRQFPFKPEHEIQITESHYHINQIRSSEVFFEDWVDKLRRLLNWNNTSFTKKSSQQTQKQQQQKTITPETSDKDRSLPKEEQDKQK